MLGAALAVGVSLLLVNRPGTEQPAGAAAAAATGAAPVHTTLVGYPVWAHFADPVAHDGSDYTIHAELQRLIRNAKRGSTIRASIHALNLEAVARSWSTRRTRTACGSRW